MILIWRTAILLLSDTRPLVHELKTYNTMMRAPYSVIPITLLCDF